ncbi:MAG: glyoxalase family protein [Bacillales bacterium]|jgi:PhnB protein|nr:glyoxalase family protein [Bacillales bacterium]
MPVNIYINFNGNCREAVQFYADVFNTESPRIMSFGDAPPNPNHPLPEEAKALVMHSELNISGTRMMFSDVFPGMPFVEGNNISLTVVSSNIDDVKSQFDKLKVDGKVEMELQETFWSKCYGNLTDKFGIKWQLSYDNGEHEKE